MSTLFTTNQPPAIWATKHNILRVVRFKYPEYLVREIGHDVTGTSSGATFCWVVSITHTDTCLHVESTAANFPSV